MIDAARPLLRAKGSAMTRCGRPDASDVGRSFDHRGRWPRRWPPRPSTPNTGGADPAGTANLRARISRMSYRHFTTPLLIETAKWAESVARSEVISGSKVAIDRIRCGIRGEKAP